MASDTTGWNLYTDEDPDETFEYRANYRLDKKVGTIQSKTTAIVITNKGSGDYTVYEDNGLLAGLGTKIYSLDAKTGNININDTGRFDAIFDGDNADQFKNVNKSTKTATLSLAKQGITINHPQTLDNYQRLINKDAYKSLGKNTAVINVNDQNNDLRDEAAPVTGDEEKPNRALAQSFVVGGSSEVLRYPRQSLEQFGYDYIQIKAFEYETGGALTGKARKRGFGPGGRFKKGYETIQLPMQPNLSESMGVDWGQNRLNNIEGTAAQGAMDAMNSFTGAGSAGDAIKGAVGAIGDTAAGLTDMLKDPGTKKQVAAFFAGQAVGNNALVTRATGQVINPNLELLFSGPQMRSFSFNFTLTPRDREEARTCRKIIRAMKRNMSPQRSDTNLFLKTPRIFQLQYIYGEGNQEHPFMNKFKPCACTSFNVNYTPDGSYMTYAGEPSMTSYTIGMSFGEIEPIYADDYKGGNNALTMGF